MPFAEEEQEYGICLSDIISLDGESGPPTLAGTPPCGPSEAPPGPKPSRREGKRMMQQQQEWKASQQAERGDGRSSPRQSQRNSHDRGSFSARKQGGTNSPASPGYSSNYSASSFAGQRRRGQRDSRNLGGKKGGADAHPPRDRYSNDNVAEQYASMSLTSLNMASLASLDKSVTSGPASGDRNSRRGRRPASWGGHSPNWRGSYGSDKNVAIITCAGCNVQIPANQAVGHASQCNRLQGQNKKAGSGAAQSPQASPRRGKGGKDTFTSAYSLFIAKELEGVKMKRDDVTSAKWKEMSPAEKYQDLANRNRSMKETLLQRMTAATAKWEGMSYDLKKPFIDEANLNKEREVREMQQFEEEEKQQREKELEQEKERLKREREAVEKRREAAAAKSVSFEDAPSSPVGKRASIDPEELARWTRQCFGREDPQRLSAADAATADSSGMHIAQLALYLTDIGVVPAPVYTGICSPDGSMQNMVNHPHDSSIMSLPTTYTSARDEGMGATSRTPSAPEEREEREWDVASATESTPSTPPSPTYACVTTTLQNANPASLRALLDYETSDDDEDGDAKDDSESDEEIVSRMVTGRQPE